MNVQLNLLMIVQLSILMTAHPNVLIKRQVNALMTEWKILLFCEDDDINDFGNELFNVLGTRDFGNGAIENLIEGGLGF